MSIRRLCDISDIVGFERLGDMILDGVTSCSEMQSKVACHGSLNYELQAGFFTPRQNIILAQVAVIFTQRDL
jgi:hypothetical protein